MVRHCGRACRCDSARSRLPTCDSSGVASHFSSSANRTPERERRCTERHAERCSRAFEPDFNDVRHVAWLEQEHLFPDQAHSENGVLLRRCSMKVLKRSGRKDRDRTRSGRTLWTRTVTSAVGAHRTGFRRIRVDQQWPRKDLARSAAARSLHR
jgi:hypothetical protein